MSQTKALTRWERRHYGTALRHAAAAAAAAGCARTDTSRPLRRTGARGRSVGSSECRRYCRSPGNLGLGHCHSVS